MSDAERGKLADASRDQLGELTVQSKESGAPDADAKRLNREDDNVPQAFLRAGWE